MSGAHGFDGNMRVRGFVTGCDGMGVCGGMKRRVFAWWWFDPVCDTGRGRRLRKNQRWRVYRRFGVSVVGGRRGWRGEWWRSRRFRLMRLCEELVCHGK